MSDHDNTAHPLDNPVWSALTGAQAKFAEGHGLARRLRTDIGAFAALHEDSRGAWDDLTAIVDDGRDVILIRREPCTAPDTWRVLGGGAGFQMVLSGTTDIAEVAGTRDLDDDDVEQMTELVKRTEPGPFQPRTIELGGYRGIFDGDRLLAMAGRRMATDDYVEVSAVCTHPDARRRGYAAAITASVARGIQAEAKTPILHVAATNMNAKRLYEQMGFVTRATLTFTAFRPQR